MDSEEITCLVCEQNCDVPEADLCDMMGLLVGDHKYSICCNCFQSPKDTEDKEYRTKWDKHFDSIDNGYRPHDTKVEQMVRDLYDHNWL